ncbi:AlpA family phage regulatory protein [Sphingomonas sp. TREG-RG-20F-R18-01]|uniref:helix-turn-helix transcriptional regulator n=1 Tax=Sphingomonas sp. TREG-RG-20F-R18-01 TaxID=2914982 RepID=UPI001F59D841
MVEVTGLSKSEIYRQMSDGSFPTSRPYRDNPKRRFWTSIEVQRWQAQQVGEDKWADLLG